MNLLLVNGEWVPAQSQQTFAVTNPMNGKVIFILFLLVQLRNGVSNFKSFVDRYVNAPASRKIKTKKFYGVNGFEFGVKYTGLKILKH